MKLVARCKLKPTEEQAELLKQTLERGNAACNAISDYAWEQGIFEQFALHAVLYGEIRESFQLGSQIVIRCLGKVADAYKKDKRSKRHFKPLGSIPFDKGNLAFRVKERETAHVSIWTVGGRKKIEIRCDSHHWKMLQNKKGESDLVYRGGEFYLYTSCDVKEKEVRPSQEALGVDLGVVNIAVDSEGEVYQAKSNAHINTVRHRYRKTRQKLQKKGTKSSRRLLKKRARKESRFAKDTNHCISKEIVAKAQDTGRAIALEDLKGIRDRLTVRRSQRAAIHSWSFYDLRQKIAYKARREGVQVVMVDPRNTSRTCPQCGCVDKRNRKTQAMFSCVECHFVGMADHIAAVNIARRGALELST